MHFELGMPKTELIFLILLLFLWLSWHHLPLQPTNSDARSSFYLILSISSVPTLPFSAAPGGKGLRASSASADSGFPPAAATSGLHFCQGDPSSLNFTVVLKPFSDSSPAG